MYERINHPGLIFPDSPAYVDRTKYASTKSEKARKFHRQKAEVAPQDWGTTTREAAAMMKISSSAAYQLLTRHRIPCRVCYGSRNTLVCVWNTAAVKRLIKAMPKQITSIPADAVTIDQLSKALCASATSIRRTCAKIKVSGKLFRINGRKTRIFSPDDVTKITQARENFTPKQQ